MRKISLFLAALLAFNTFGSVNAVTAPVISAVVVSLPTTAKTEVGLRFQVDQRAVWKIQLFDVCQNSKISERSGEISSARTINWKVDTANLASGVYEFRITAHNTLSSNDTRHFSIGLSGSVAKTMSACESAVRLTTKAEPLAQIKSAVELSKNAFESSNTVVVLGSSTTIETTAIATAFAAKASYPVLLTNGSKLSGVTRSEIQRLGANKILVVADSNEISDKVLAELRKLTKQTFRKTSKTANGLASLLYRKSWLQDQQEAVVANLDGPYKFVVPAISYAAANGHLLFDSTDSASQVPLSLNGARVTAIGSKKAISDSVLSNYVESSRVNGSSPTISLALAKTSSSESSSIMLVGPSPSFTPLEILSTIQKRPAIILSANGLTTDQRDWLEDRTDITQVFTASTEPLVSDLALIEVARFLNNRDATSELPEIPQPEFPALSAPATFAFSGAGLGHGIGMSQWGAYQLAIEGRSASEILNFYYTNSSVGSAYAQDDIYVNLQNRIPRVSLRVKPVDKGAVKLSIQAYRTVDGNEISSRVTLTDADSVTVNFDSANNKLKFKFSGNPDLSLPASDWAKINWSGTRFAPEDDQTAAIVQVAGSGESFVSTSTTSAGSWYGFGQIQLKAAAASESLGSGIQVVNRVRFNDEYLYGLGEVPSSWPAAALQAQVVAARSYAYYDVYKTSGLKPDGTPAVNSRSSACFCQIYDDIRDQNFVGWSKISSTGGNLWKAAVDATLLADGFGQVVLHGGKVAQTFYSAANGGATQNNEDVWGGSPLGYLRSVPDPGSIVAYDVVGRWSPRVRSQATVAAAFGLDNVSVLDFSDRLISGAVKTVTATSTSGATATITADQFRLRVKSESGAALGSNWFHRSEVPVDNRVRFAATGILQDRMLEFTYMPAATAKTAVLTPLATNSDPATFAAAAAYAGIRGFAFLPVSQSGDLTRLKTVLTKQGISSVQAIGEVDPSLLAGLGQSGMSVLTISAGTSAELSTLLAERSGSVLTAGVVVANPTETSVLPLAVSVAVRTKRPLVFAENSGFAAVTSIWLSTKQIDTATIVGSGLNVPDRVVAGIESVNRLDTQNLNAATRRSIWLGTGPVRYIAVSAIDSDYQIGVLAAATGAPILYPNASNLGYLSNWIKRQPLLSTVINAGGDTQFVTAIRQV